MDGFSIFLLLINGVLTLIMLCILYLVHRVNAKADAAIENATTAIKKSDYTHQRLLDLKYR